MRTKTNHFLLPTSLVVAVCDNWPIDWPVFKLNELCDTDKGEDATLTKIAPVPFFTVQDGLNEDLEAGLVLERIQSMDNFKTRITSNMQPTSSRPAWFNSS